MNCLNTRVNIIHSFGALTWQKKECTNYNQKAGLEGSTKVTCYQVISLKRIIMREWVQQLSE